MKNQPDINSTTIIIQYIVQIITIIPYGIAFWREKKKNVLTWVAISCSLFMLGYWLCGAYSGIIIAIGTFITTIIGIYFDKTHVKNLYLKLLVFIIMVFITIFASVLIENTNEMWLILIAGFFDYFAYIVFCEYGKTMHIILILSQITLVIYEIIYCLFIFAILDFITAIIILFHLIRIFKNNRTI